MNYIYAAMIGLIVFGFNGCGEDNNSKNENAPNNRQEEEQKDKHPETNKLKAAGAVGYDGDALKKSVDKMLDQNEKRQKELEEAQNGWNKKENE